MTSANELFNRAARAMVDAYTRERTARAGCFGSSCHVPTSEEVAELTHRSVVLAAQMDVVTETFGVGKEQVTAAIEQVLELECKRINEAATG